VFEGDKRILHSLHYDNNFKDQVIDEEEDDEAINKDASELEKGHSNTILRFVVRMEQLYDLHEKFKRVTNYNKHKYTMQYEVINLGLEQDPKNVNLELGFSPSK
jgi:hypothetical protein